VHPPEDVLKPTPEMFERFWEASQGHIRVMTIAPELPGAVEIIAEAAKRGVCVSLGHSDATLAVARAAIDAGASHSTHTFNAMRPLDHRDPGIIAEVLTNEKVSADVIADGIHLDPTMVKLFLKAKGSEKAILITDATSATGMPDGSYPLGSTNMQVKAGKCIADGRLAGSVLTMDAAVRNVMKFAGWELQHAVGLATLNPARVTGLNARGTLKPGARADITVLNPSGEVKNTIIGGAAS
jgi:N-acetylglucosamine-6-phosphate deacetylase